MSDKDNNSGGSLVGDFRKWWRHVQPKNIVCHVFLPRQREVTRDEPQHGVRGEIESLMND